MGFQPGGTNRTGNNRTKRPNFSAISAMSVVDPTMKGASVAIAQGTDQSRRQTGERHRAYHPRAFHRHQLPDRHTLCERLRARRQMQRVEHIHFSGAEGSTWYTFILRNFRLSSQ